jgi:hypothetical protein
MSDWSLVNRSHVLAAIEEDDRLGSREFLRRYGFRRAHTHTLWHGGQEHDAKAILGVAYLHATGRPATWDEVAAEDAVAKALLGLGFDVVSEEEPVTSQRPLKATPTRSRSAKPEPVVSVCPRCHLALPASGLCDFCD